MKFSVHGVDQGPGLDQFKAEWIAATIHENHIIMGAGEKRISSAQLLVINLFCNNDEGYARADDMTITSNGPCQAELEALFRARGRALTGLFQREGLGSPV